jgi:hypothetical protein
MKTRGKTKRNTNINNINKENINSQAYTVFIPGNVPSSKNSKVWTGKFLVNSKTTQKYKKATVEIFQDVAAKFRSYYDELPKPIKVNFKFIRGSKHKFDYINPLQTIQDLMVDYEWIEDDNADCLIPSFSPFEYDKANPGVLITILKDQS